MKEYQDEMLDVEKMLILNYKKLGLNDDEVILLLLTYTLYQTGNTFINPSDLALFSNFTRIQNRCFIYQFNCKRMDSNPY